MDSQVNDKYIVLKREEFEAMADKFSLNRPFTKAFALVLELDLPGAEVIRHQDITAAPIFHHYASGIETLLELCQQFSIPVDEKQLKAIADHFHGAAVDAEEHPYRKVPD